MTPRLADTPILETGRLILRAPAPQDWPAWQCFMASDRSRFVGGPTDTGKAWRAFCHAVGHWAVRGYGSFVFTLKGDDTALGMVGPWHPADWPETEIGWTVWSEQAEGRGHAFEAAQASRAYAYDVLGWPGAVSYIAPGNHRSVALARRLGCWPDDSAPAPGDDPCIVYRHPVPGGKSKVRP